MERLEFTGERFVPGTEGEIEHEHLHRYLFALHLCHGLDVLDVASGEGYGSALLATVARSVVGVELVPEVVAQASRNYRAPNLSFHVGDAAALPLPDAGVDVVISYETLEHLENQAGFMAEVKRVLRPRGLLVLSSPVRGIYSPDNPNPFHVHELDRTELDRLVGTAFANRATLSQGPTIGSALLKDAEAPDATADFTGVFWREGYRGGFVDEPPMDRSPYVVIVASDGPLPAFHSSLLQDRPYIARLLGTLDAARKDLATELSRLSQLEASLEAVRSERKRLEQEVEASGKELAATREERDGLIARLTRLTESVTRLDREVETLRKQLEEATRWTWQTLPSKLVKAIKRGARLRPRHLLRLGMPAELRQRRDLKSITASGFFDARYYLEKNPDVASAGAEPLRHYVEHGAREGRNPHPMFDTSYYLEQNRDLLARKRINPLAHFASAGLAEGRRPHPAFSAEDFRSASSGVRSPLPSPGALAMPEDATSPGPTVERRIVPPPAPSTFRVREIQRQRSRSASPAAKGPRILILTHVLPFPPRAGNEYRIHRMLRWLRSEGYVVQPIVCPLPGEVLDPADIARAAAENPNLIVLQRDGTVLLQSDLDEVVSAVEALDGKRPAEFPIPSPPPPGRTQRILGLEATFCPDHLMDLVLRLDQVGQPQVVLANYVFMSRVLPLLRPATLRIIDTHDVFSTKGSKVVQYGVADDLLVSEKEEASLLSRAELIIAIQPEEERELRALCPGREVVTAGVDFDVPKSSGIDSPEPIVLCVGSNNPMNVKGAKDFLSLGWPLVRMQVPGACLLIAGRVGEALEAGGEGVEILGQVDDLDRLYARARVVVNPSVAGTGLKVKTLEALSRSRPVVVWPSGVDGFSPALRRFCDVATNWYDFARRVSQRLVAVEGGWSTSDKNEIVRQLSPEVVYSALGKALRARLDGVAGAAARHG
jgi:SAM-dependent methyltransferase/glycosyltransferase involved in cell wall biosynthesis